VRLGSLFTGIGAPEQGALRVYKNVENVFACEFDKYARQSFEANYDIAPEHFHVDINDMDGKQYQGKVDVIVGGSPCQAFSIAGLKKGLSDKRGQLIWQYYRIIKEAQPPIFIYENVKGMVSDNNGQTLKDFLEVFRDIGYNCHYEVVNTKDYGVPQNRERVYIVGFKDADLYHRFSFAPKVPLTKRLKDVLEDDVDEKYYLSEKAIKGFITHTQRMKERGNGFKFEPTDGDVVASSITTRAGGRPDDNFVKVAGMLDNKAHDSARRVYEVNGICSTITAVQGGGHEPKIAIGAIRGRNPENPKSRVSGLPTEQMLEINENGTSNCLTTVQKNNVVVEPYRIRKLTPRECLRLQDFHDAFKQVVSNSQMYKQAGNSMSVNILEMIFIQIEKAKSAEPTGSLFDFMEDVS